MGMCFLVFSHAEMVPYSSVLFLFLIGLTSSSLEGVQGGEKGEEFNNDPFSLTSEWNLKKDHAVVHGLQMSLKDGERDERQFQDMEEDQQAEMDMRKSKRILQKMAGEGTSKEVSPSKVLVDVEKVNSNLLSYTKLKEELRSKQADVKCDIKILSKTIDQYKELTKDSSMDEIKKKETEEELLNFLKNLVNQIDNAMEFIIKMNGYKSVILPSLNSTYSSVRFEALCLLASAVQNSPHVQKVLVQEGAVSLLLRVLVSDSSSKVKASALYALTCLMRDYPSGQSIFLEKEALPILKKENDILGGPENQLGNVSLFFGVLGFICGLFFLCKCLRSRSPTSNVSGSTLEPSHGV